MTLEGQKSVTNDTKKCNVFFELTLTWHRAQMTPVLHTRLEVEIRILQINVARIKNCAILVLYEVGSTSRLDSGAVTDPLKVAGTAVTSTPT